jgi:hypothetical protein
MKRIPASAAPYQQTREVQAIGPVRFVVEFLRAPDEQAETPS